MGAAKLDSRRDLSGRHDASKFSIIRELTDLTSSELRGRHECKFPIAQGKEDGEEFREGRKQGLEDQKIETIQFDKEVSWIPQDSGEVKINTDGCALGNQVVVVSDQFAGIQIRLSRVLLPKDWELLQAKL
ncbi:hypothetical protein FRX31_022065 [Thalictrum thalictroides]|uniref:Uncharacterized protein n=1 Tax=Thalictrum thalictroides TaxID=46969 RepID=A0A7J6VVD4_THATH|nr:hypothetical protein FRX31_022065 [Thalictrum thalictroides]